MVLKIIEASLLVSNVVETEDTVFEDLISRIVLPLVTAASQDGVE